MTKRKEEEIRDFTSGNILKQIITFASPLFLSNVLQIVYNITDMLIVGQFIGKNGLSAVSVGGDVTNFLTFLGMGFANAGQVIISQLIGAGERKQLSKLIGTMFTFLSGAAVLLSVLGLLMSRRIMVLMNTPGEALDSAWIYTVTCMTGLLFIYGYNVISAIFRGFGDSKHPLYFILIATVINIVLDLVFVAGLKMGTFGTALATVIGQAVSLIYSMRYLLKHREALMPGFTKADLKIDKRMMVTLGRLGVPMAISSVAVQSSKLFVNSWINSYGVVVSALAGIGNKIANITNLTNQALSQAGANMVGQNIGAEKYDRVPKIMKAALAVNTAISVLLIVFMILKPRLVFRMFTGDAEVLALSAVYIPVAIVNFVSSALRAGMNTLITGSGNHRISFVVAILDGVVNRIGFAVLLGLVLNLGYLGFWYGDVIANFTPFFVGIFFYLSGRWKTRKFVIQAAE